MRVLQYFVDVVAFSHGYKECNEAMKEKKKKELLPFELIINLEIVGHT